MRGLREEEKRLSRWVRSKVLSVASPTCRSCSDTLAGCLLTNVSGGSSSPSLCVLCDFSYPPTPLGSSLNLPLSASASCFSPPVFLSLPLLHLRRAASASFIAHDFGPPLSLSCVFLWMVWFIMHFCTLCIWRTLMCVRVCHAGLKSFNKKRYFKANVGAQWKNLQGTDSVGKFKWGQRLAIKSVVQNSIWRRSVLMCLRRRLVSSVNSPDATHIFNPNVSTCVTRSNFLEIWFVASLFKISPGWHHQRVPPWTSSVWIVVVAPTQGDILSLHITLHIFITPQTNLRVFWRTYFNSWADLDKNNKFGTRTTMQR